MVSLPDIAGTGVTVPFASPNITASVVAINVTGTGSIRWGGPEVTANQGIRVFAGGGYFFPYQGHDRPYSLNQLSAYIPVGATLEVAYEPWG